MGSKLSKDLSNLFVNTDSELTKYKMKWICYKYAKHMSNYNVDGINFKVNYVVLINKLSQGPEFICQLAFVIATLRIYHDQEYSQKYISEYTTSTKKLKNIVGSIVIDGLLNLAIKVSEL